MSKIILNIKKGVYDSNCFGDVNFCEENAEFYQSSKNYSAPIIDKSYHLSAIKRRIYQFDVRLVLMNTFAEDLLRCKSDYKRGSYIQYSNYYFKHEEAGTWIHYFPDKIHSVRIGEDVFDKNVELVTAAIEDGTLILTIGYKKKIKNSLLWEDGNRSAKSKKISSRLLTEFVFKIKIPKDFFQIEGRQRKHWKKFHNIRH